MHFKLTLLYYLEILRKNKSLNVMKAKKSDTRSNFSCTVARNKILLGGVSDTMQFVALAFVPNNPEPEKEARENMQPV